MRRTSATSLMSLALAVALALASVPLFYGSISAYSASDTPLLDIDPGILGQADPEIDPGIFGEIDPEIDPGILGGVATDNQTAGWAGPTYLLLAIVCFGAAFVITKQSLRRNQPQARPIGDDRDGARPSR